MQKHVHTIIQWKPEPVFINANLQIAAGLKLLPWSSSTNMDRTLGEDSIHSMLCAGPLLDVAVGLENLFYSIPGR